MKTTHSYDNLPPVHRPQQGGEASLLASNHDNTPAISELNNHIPLVATNSQTQIPSVADERHEFSSELNAINRWNERTTDKTRYPQHGAAANYGQLPRGTASQAGTPASMVAPPTLTPYTMYTASRAGVPTSMIAPPTLTPHNIHGQQRQSVTPTSYMPTVTNSQSMMNLSPPISAYPSKLE